jgi:hypothetical protein
LQRRWEQNRAPPATDNQHYRSLKAYPEAYPGLEAPADAVMMIVPVAEPAAALTMAA